MKVVSPEFWNSDWIPPGIAFEPMPEVLKPK
jgi:hypothetical protein